MTAGASLDQIQPPPIVVAQKPAVTAPTTRTVPTVRTPPPPPTKPANYGKPHPDHAIVDLFGAKAEPKKPRSTASRIGDVGKKVAKLKEQVAKNPHPYLVKSLADHERLLQSLKDLTLYIEP